jgi:hypothetical protein
MEDNKETPVVPANEDGSVNTPEPDEYNGMHGVCVR